jgi:hypothetical protein
MLIYFIKKYKEYIKSLEIYREAHGLRQAKQNYYFWPVLNQYFKLKNFPKPKTEQKLKIQ